MLDKLLKSFQSGNLLEDARAWLNQIYVKTWKNNPQNVYNLAAIAAAMLILIVSIRIGMMYMKSEIVKERLAPVSTEEVVESVPKISSKKKAQPRQKADAPPSPSKKVEPSTPAKKAEAKPKRAAAKKAAEAVASPPKKTVRARSTSPVKAAVVLATTPARAEVRVTSKTATPAKKTETPAKSLTTPAKPVTPAHKKADTPKSTARGRTASKSRSASKPRSTSASTRTTRSAAAKKASSKK